MDPGGSRRSWHSEPPLSSRPRGPQHPAAPIPRRSPSKTTSHRGDYLFGHFLPTTIPGKLLRQPRSLVIVELILSPILFIAGIHFPRVLLHNQGYPKVCLDSLNLPNSGISFAGISSLSSCYLFSPTRDLNALI
jgi:hypothetical protein